MEEKLQIIPAQSFMHEKHLTDTGLFSNKTLRHLFTHEQIEVSMLPLLQPLKTPKLTEDEFYALAPPKLMARLLSVLSRHPRKEKDRALLAEPQALDRCSP